MSKFIVLIFTFLFSLSANAWLFGPKSYEECMNDGKVGRTNAELYELRNYCSLKFPEKAKDKKLFKLFTSGNSNLRCVINGQPYEFKFSKDFVKYENKTYKIILKDSNAILFNMEKYTIDGLNTALGRAKAAGDLDASKKLNEFIIWMGKDESVLYHYIIKSDGLITREIIGDTSRTKYYETGICVEN